MSGRLTIVQLERKTAGGKSEVLYLKPGVNVIVGPQNAGKSTWLQMLDYLMGETESAAKKFDEVLVRKYRSVSATMRMGEGTVVLERQWNEDGTRSTMTLNGARFPAADVQSLFLERLGIPTLRYPQGNVWASERTWPSLGWRSLLRHLYRRQNFWGSLVPQQPESEQHACLLQFLGLAEYLFSDELATLVDKRRRIARLQSQKEFFVEMMHEIASDLVGEDEISVGLTAQSIERARSRVSKEIDDLITARDGLLTKVGNRSLQPSGELVELLEERVRILNRRNELVAALENIGARIDELGRYRSSLCKELERLDRAGVAAAIFEDVRVTHCPACDQSVEGRSRTHDQCFLCGQPMQDATASKEAATRRFKFERDQVAAELAEADELIHVAEEERVQKRGDCDETDRRLRAVEAAARPFQSAISGILPEEVALMDQRIGSLNARREALARLHAPLATRDALSTEIDALQSEAGHLDASLAEKEDKVELQMASDRLSDGFNTYLNAIHLLDENTWTKSAEVSVRVSEKRTQYLIAGRPAMSQLGGTLTIFFLFAYHYALLNLCRFPDCHYPGITVLDVWPDIAKGVAIRDRLSIVFEPFVRLARDSDIGTVQVIATSRDFAPQPDVNLIQLTQTWR